MIFKFLDRIGESKILNPSDSIDYLVEEPKYRERIWKSHDQVLNCSLIALVLGITLIALELGLLIIAANKWPWLRENNSDVIHFGETMCIVVVLLYLFLPPTILFVIMRIAGSKVYGREWRIYRKWYWSSDKKNKCEIYEDENGCLQIKK